MSKILVTGHLGYIGSHLYKKLEDLGYEVIGVDLKEGNDILDGLPCNNVDYVFHLAALPRVQYSVENPVSTLRNNVLSTSILLDWSVKHKVKRFIFSSSSAIYGDGDGPLSPYGLHKLISEQECKLYSKLYGLDTISLRYFNVYSEDQPYDGPYTTVISNWMDKIKYTEPLMLEGDGTQSRDFIHVEDVVFANIVALSCKANFNGQTFDVGSGVSTEINEIKDYINDNNVVEWEYVPERLGDVKHTKANIENTKDLGWGQYVSLKEGLKRCFNEKD